MSTSDDTVTIDNVKKIVRNMVEDNSTIKELDFIRKVKTEEINVEKIGSHGYMNDIFKISALRKDGNNKTAVVLKRAFPYMKRMGRSHPTPQGRNLLEFRVLRKLHTICPANAVIPFCYSTDQKAFLMEYMSNYENLKTRLIGGKVDKVSIDYLAKALGQLHKETNVSSMDEDTSADLRKEFENAEMCEIMATYIFGKTFDPEDADKLVKPKLRHVVQELYQDQRLIQDVTHFRRLYREKKECLIHGDLHTGSVMVPLAKEEDHPKMFDTEFSCIGPPAFDLGFLMAHFLMAYYQHELTEENNDLHRQVMYKIQEACSKFLETYFDKRGQVSVAYVSELYQEVAGFAACEIFFRVIGCGSSENIAHSADMEEAALHCGLRLMRQHRMITNAGKLMLIGLQLC